MELPQLKLSITFLNLSRPNINVFCIVFSFMNCRTLVWKALRMLQETLEKIMLHVKYLERCSDTNWCIVCFDIEFWVNAPRNNPVLTWSGCLPFWMKYTSNGWGNDVNIIVPHLFIETVQLSECENKMSFNQQLVFILLCFSLDATYSEVKLMKLIYKIHYTYIWNNEKDTFPST